MKKYHISRNRKLLPFPAQWNKVYQSSDESLKIHGAKLEQAYGLEEDGIWTQIEPVDQWDHFAAVILDNLLNKENYLEDIYKKQKELGEQLYGWCEDQINNYNENIDRVSILRLLELIKIKHNELCVYNVIPWFFGGDVFREELFKHFKKHYQISADDFSTLEKPPKLSFVGREEQRVYELALKKIEGQNISSEINKLQQDFYWITFGYDGPDIKDHDYYINEIDRITSKYSVDELRLKAADYNNYEKTINRVKKELYSKYKITQRDQKLIYRLELLNNLTDERKEFALLSYFLIDRLLRSLADLLEVPKVAFKYMTTEEIQELVDPNDIKKLFNYRENNPVCYKAESGRVICLQPEETNSLLKELEAESDNEDNISGFVASRGTNKVVRGQAKILFKPSDEAKMNKGDILVASMTTPDFVLAMRKAEAIITDEGGVTCHAAIVSRELGIPCIIGTKNATKVLKDGDLVEVDANTGSVKIIKRAR